MRTEDTNTTAWLPPTDSLGPESVLHVYDPETGMKGVVVIDTMLWGVAGGGTRMSTDITTDEICGLARAMTYKFALLGVPLGGAKSGLWAAPGPLTPERAARMRAFGRAIRPLMEGGRLSIGLDIGTQAEDLGHMYEGAGLVSPATGLGATEIDGERLENLATGYGAVVAATVACEAAGLTIAGSSAAIEGFGKAGSSAARYLAERNAKVVAVSTIDGALYRRDGLDVATLTKLRRQYGDGLVEHYPTAERIPRQMLYTLPVDILIPGARPNVIDQHNAGKLRAKVIASVANNPIARAAEPELFRRGVRVVPDFIANAGGAVAVMVDWLGGSPADVFRVLDQQLGASTRAVLTAAAEQNVAPTFVAVSQAERALGELRRARQRLSFEEVKARVAARFRAYADRPAAGDSSGQHSPPANA